MSRKAKISMLAGAMAVVAILPLAATVQAGRGDGPVVYVTSQDLFFDSIVTTDLPPKGKFQELVPGGPSGLMTEFGPGDQGYRGGRWWLDANGSGDMDDEDRYFSCPLLGPGRPMP